MSGASARSIQAHVTYRLIAARPESQEKKSDPEKVPLLMGRILLSGARRFTGVFFSRPSIRIRFPLIPSRSLSHTATMASADSLTASVQALSLQSTTKTSKFAGCFPSLNPMDIYREHIAEELGKAAGIDPELIFSRLAWTNTLDKGDLSLPV